MNRELEGKRDAKRAVCQEGAGLEVQGPVIHKQRSRWAQEMISEVK